MTPEDKRYLAYLAYWMTDRIITAVYQAQTETRIFDAKMPEVREEAEELYQNFYTPEDIEIEKKIKEAQEKLKQQASDLMFKEDI
jgi:formyltetrahydrofolate synthetase